MDVPYLTYGVIFAIIGAILTMLIEGTYFKEVIYTTALFGIIVFFGLLSENWVGVKSVERLI